MVKGCIYTGHKIFIFGTPNMQLIYHTLQTYTLTCSCHSHAITLNNYNIYKMLGFYLRTFSYENCVLFHQTQGRKTKNKTQKG